MTPFLAAPAGTAPAGETPADISLAALRAAYAAGTTTPTEVIGTVLDRIAARGDDHVWISRFPDDALLDRARELAAAARDGIDGMPLYGVPLGVKDSIDVQGLPTTNACPDYAYLPERSAFAVRKLLAAGAIVVGKTNLDQFATGLVGVRSPYGAPESVFGGGMISGGSSSGSAVAVAAGVVPVAIATDTAGIPGRVPAALNGIVGMKPTLGLISTAGLLPACRSIDCVTVMSRRVDDALAVLEVIAGPDPDNPWSRPVTLRPPVTGAPRLGLPGAGDLNFFGDEQMRQAHLAARAAAVASLGASVEPVPLADFREAGGLLYAGPWVAERLADLDEFLAGHPDSVLPVTRRIIESGANFTAAQAFRAQHRMAELRLATGRVWDRVDALVLPTIGTTFTQAEVTADPIARNTVLGHYTQFTNLLDLCGIAVPSGSTADGRPVSLMLLGPAGADLVLAGLAARMLGEPPAARAPAEASTVERQRGPSPCSPTVSQRIPPPEDAT